MRGLDQVQVELIRQVRLHCAERGALFERCRRQQHEWTVRLMLAVEELQRARDDAAAVAREAAQLQEARLEEQLRLSQTQQQQLATLRGELQWLRRAHGAEAGDGAILSEGLLPPLSQPPPLIAQASRNLSGASPEAPAPAPAAAAKVGLNKWKRVKTMISFLGGARELAASAAGAPTTEIEEERLRELAEALRSELRHEQLSKLVLELIAPLRPSQQIKAIHRARLWGSEHQIRRLTPTLQLTRIWLSVQVRWKGCRSRRRSRSRPTCWTT